MIEKDKPKNLSAGKNPTNTEDPINPRIPLWHSGSLKDNFFQPSELSQYFRQIFGSCPETVRDLRSDYLEGLDTKDKRDSFRGVLDWMVGCKEAVSERIPHEVKDMLRELSNRISGGDVINPDDVEVGLRELGYDWERVSNGELLLVVDDDEYGRLKEKGGWDDSVSRIPLLDPLLEWIDHWLHGQSDPEFKNTLTLRIKLGIVTKEDLAKAEGLDVDYLHSILSTGFNSNNPTLIKKNALFMGKLSPRTRALLSKRMSPKEMENIQPHMKTEFVGFPGDGD